MRPNPKQKQKQERARRSNQQGSEVVWRSHPSWKGMLGWYVKWNALVLFIALVMFVLVTQAGYLSMFWVVFTVLVGIGAVTGIGKLIRNATVFTVTNRGVVEKTGILTTVKEQAAFENITNISVERTIIERLLKIGRIDIFTAGEYQGTSGFVNFWGVNNPDMVERIIEDQRYAGDDIPEPPDKVEEPEEW
jgi:uncharacterized membrane protein YdbT with pleckstrin-like domain